MLERATGPDATTYVHTLTRTGQEAFVNELAHARNWTLYRQQQGAEAEAVAATMLTLILARSAYLTTTAADQEDWLALYTATPDVIDAFLDAFELTHWLERTTNT